jgi:hypothetical protein
VGSRPSGRAAETQEGERRGKFLASERGRTTGQQGTRERAGRNNVTTETGLLTPATSHSRRRNVSKDLLKLILVGIVNHAPLISPVGGWLSRQQSIL